MKHINIKGKSFQLVKPENNCALICDDEVYHIMPSGFSEETKRYMVVDCGPHFNREVSYMSKEQIQIIFGVDVSQPEFDCQTLPEQPHTVKEEQTTSVDVEHRKEWVETIEVAIIGNIEQGMANLPLNDYTSRMACLRAIEQVKMLAGAKWNQGKEAGETVKGDDLEDKLCRMYDLWVVEKRQSFRSAVKEFIKNEYANQFKTNK